MKDWLGKHKNRILTLALIFLVLVVVAIPNPMSTKSSIGIRVVSAAGMTDYSLAGTNDNTVFQTAIDDLPATGGVLQVVSTGTIDWANGITVTRAIDNVIVQGAGLGTFFDGDGATPIFTAGGDNWSFRDFSTDSGGIELGATINWSMTNVLLDTDYYAYRGSVFSGESGIFSDVDALTLEAPTGRGATLVVTASDSSNTSKTQADYVCDGTADQSEINTALTAASATNGAVALAEGTYTLTDQIFVPANTTLTGIGRAILDGTATDTAIVPTGDSCTINNLTIQNGCTSEGIDIRYAYVKVLNTRFLNIKDPVDAWAAAIHIMDATAHDVLIDGVYIYDCDRGIEIEDLAYNITCLNGYVDTVPAAGSSPLYSVGAHGHAPNWSHDIVYRNFTIVNSAGFYAFTQVKNVLFDNMRVYNPTRWANAAVVDPTHSLTNSYIEINNGSITNRFIMSQGRVDNVVYKQTGGDYTALINGSVQVSNCLFMGWAAAYYPISVLTGNVNIENSEFTKNPDSTINQSLWIDGGTVHINNCYFHDAGTDSIRVAGGELWVTDSIIATKRINVSGAGAVVRLIGNTITSSGHIFNATTILSKNIGYITENSGTATVVNTAISIVVNHGLATTPTRVFISLTNNPTNDPQVCWVDTLTTTQFTINTKVDPGATGAIFNWKAVIGEGN